MNITLEKAKKNLINAQNKAALAYKNVEKAREIYNKLLNKTLNVSKKRTFIKNKKRSITKKGVTSNKNKKRIITKKRITSNKNKKRSISTKK